MPSIAREALLALFRNRPELAPELLRDALGLELPHYISVRIESADFTDVTPAEYRADLVLLLVDGEPVLGIVLEVQLARDARKRFAWPVYVAGLRARFECPCVLFVVAPDESVAEWAATPIELGADSTFCPVVLGPSGVPVVRDPSAPAELCVLSAMAHGRASVDQAVAIALAAAGAAGRLDPDLRVVYFDMVLAALGEAARKAFAMIPQGYRFQSEEFRRSFDLGEARGEARGLAKGKAACLIG